MLRILMCGVVALLAAGCGQEADVELACEEFIGRKLKAPASAEYTHVQVGEAIGDGWRSNGYVDAENGFGAPLRTRFECTVEETDGGWKLKRLVFPDS